MILYGSYTDISSLSEEAVIYNMQYNYDELSRLYAKIPNDARFSELKTLIHELMFDGDFKAAYLIHSKAAQLKKRKANNEPKLRELIIKNELLSPIDIPFSDQKEMVELSRSIYSQEGHYLEQADKCIGIISVHSASLEALEDINKSLLNSIHQNEAILERKREESVD